MSTVKQFHIGDVLSVSTGMMLSVRGMEGIYDILNYMTGDNLFTHQLPRALKECRPWILRQHPTLAFSEVVGGFELKLKVAKDEDRAELCRSFVEAAAKSFGETLNVEPIPRDDHANIDPLTELEQMVGKDRIIVVNAPTEEK